MRTALFVALCVAMLALLAGKAINRVSQQLVNPVNVALSQR